MAKTRRLRTRKYKRKGGTGTPPRPTQAQINKTYKTRNLNRPPPLDIHKTPTSSEKKRKESEERRKKSEERREEEKKSKRYTVQNMKSWREERINLQAKFAEKYKTKP